jgi:hypothetical protein
VHVPGFGLRKIPHAFTVIAAIILALAGCLAAPVPAQAASSLSLVILPDQGENAIYSFVNSATSSINVTHLRADGHHAGKRPGRQGKGRRHRPGDPGPGPEIV